MSMRRGLLLLLMSSGCAVMHSTQLGDIDADTVMSSKPFEIKLAAVGFDAQEAAETAAAIAELSGKSGDTFSTVGEVQDVVRERVESLVAGGRAKGLSITSSIGEGAGSSSSSSSLSSSSTAAALASVCRPGLGYRPQR